MAQLSSEFNFTGSLGNLTAYKMKGVDRMILRMKGGPSKKTIKTSPKFALVRRNNAEFGGRARATRFIMMGMHPLKALADYNIAGPLNALMKPIQVLDKQNTLGKRHVLLSQNPRLLEGFSLNRQNPFDAMLRASLTYTMSRETLSATLDLPAMIPGINLFLSQRYPLYSVVAVLSVIPDVYYHENGYKTLLPDYNSTYVMSPWYPVLKGSPANTLELSLTNTPPDIAFSLMLSIGIRFGTMADASTIQQVRRAGAAKILAVR